MSFTEKQLKDAMHASVDWFLKEPQITNNADPKTATEVMLASENFLRTLRNRAPLDWRTLYTSRPYWRSMYELKPRPLRFQGVDVAFDTCHDESIYFMSAKGLHKIQGLKASGVIIDDPHNDGARAMDTKTVLTEQQMAEHGISIDYSRRALVSSGAEVTITPAKKVKPVKKDYSTIGVRFIYGQKLDQVYTYRIRKGAKVHLGQELIVPSTVAGVKKQSVAVVVEIHSTPQDTGPFDYKFVTGKVSPL